MIAEQEILLIPDASWTMEENKDESGMFDLVYVQSFSSRLMRRDKCAGGNPIQCVINEMSARELSLYGTVVNYVKHIISDLGLNITSSIVIKELMKQKRIRGNKLIE